MIVIDFVASSCLTFYINRYYASRLVLLQSNANYVSNCIETNAFIEGCGMDEMMIDIWVEFEPFLIEMSAEIISSWAASNTTAWMQHLLAQANNNDKHSHASLSSWSHHHTN